MRCELKNIEIYYEIYGSGTPLLMIHGFTQDLRVVKGCMEPIFNGRSNFKRIYFDLPGMGKTEGKEWIESSDQILEIVIEFIEKILPNEKFIVVGQSYGAYIARGLIHKFFHDIMGICFICPLIIPNPYERDLPEFKPIKLNPSLLEKLDPEDRKEFKNMAIIQDEYVWERFRDDVLPGLNNANKSFLDKIFTKGYAFSFEVDKLTNKFKKPTLFLQGRQDPSAGYRDGWKILENYSHASYIVLDKAGHLLQIEQKELFDSLINEWLDRIMKSNN